MDAEVFYGFLLPHKTNTRLVSQTGPRPCLFQSLFTYLSVFLSFIAVNMCTTHLVGDIRVYVRDWPGPGGWGGVRERERESSLHAVNVFQGSRGTAFLILHLDTIYRQMQIEAQCPLKKRIGGSESLSERFGKENNLLLLLE